MVTTYIGIVNLVYLLVDAPDEMAEIFAIMEHSTIAPRRSRSILRPNAS